MVQHSADAVHDKDADLLIHQLAGSASPSAHSPDSQEVHDEVAAKVSSNEENKPKKRTGRAVSGPNSGRRQEQNRRAQQAYRGKKQDHLRTLEEIAASMTERMQATYHVLMSAVNEIDALARLANLNYATQTLAERIRGTALEGPLLEIKHNNERLSASSASWNAPSRYRRHDEDTTTEDERPVEILDPRISFQPAPRLYRSTTAPSSSFHVVSPSFSRHASYTDHVSQISAPVPTARPVQADAAAASEELPVMHPESDGRALPLPPLRPRYTPYTPAQRPRSATYGSQPGSPSTSRADMTFQWTYPYDHETSSLPFQGPTP